MLKVIYPLKKGVFKVQGPLRIYDSLLEVQTDSKKNLKLAMATKPLESNSTQGEDDFVNESSSEDEDDEEIDHDVILHSEATKGHAVAIIRDMLDNSHIRAFLVEQVSVTNKVYFDLF